jgi:hypothetical protein
VLVVAVDDDCAAEPAAADDDMPGVRARAFAVCVGLVV